MRGLVFWVEGSLSTASELWQEPLRLLGEALSEYLPVWLLRYYRHSSAPAYEMAVWDGQGREITFWGAWPTTQLYQIVESLWQAEAFVPTTIVNIASSETKYPTRWKRRFRTVIVDFFLRQADNGHIAACHRCPCQVQTAFSSL